MSESPVRKWVNPKYADVVALVDELYIERKREGSMANCGNCSGTGRTIIKDKKGKTYSVTCGNCKGTGQK